MNNEKITLRMNDGYGIATNYRCKNECPVEDCQAKIIKVIAQQCVSDGEHTYVHTFTCENNHVIQYSDMRKYNGYE